MVYFYLLTEEASIVMEQVKELTEKKKWTHPRHAVVTNTLKALGSGFCAWLYGIEVEPFREQGDRP